MREAIYRLPPAFLKKLQTAFPHNFALIAETFLHKKTSSFRINYLKTDLLNLRRQLIQHHVRAQELEWPRGSFLLKDDMRQFQETPVYQKGMVYVQNVSSMIPPLVLEPENGEHILDLCAAPGTKTTEIVSLAPQVRLTAIEKNRVRFYKLLANLNAQGIQSVKFGGSPYQRSEFQNIHQPEVRESFEGSAGKVAEDDDAEGEGTGEAFNEDRDHDFTGIAQAPVVRVMLIDGMWVRKKFPETFDRILIDAPCSAEGRFWANDPRTFKYWSERKVKEMVHTQRKLLSAAFFALKDGGTMVYSTCTFSPEENEENIDWFLQKYRGALEAVSVKIPLKGAMPGLAHWQGRKLLCAGLTRRILPNEFLEGFFVAKLRKIAA